MSCYQAEQGDRMLLKAIHPPKASSAGSAASPRALHLVASSKISHTSQQTALSGNTGHTAVTVLSTDFGKKASITLGAGAASKVGPQNP